MRDNLNPAAAAPRAAGCAGRRRGRAIQRDGPRRKRQAQNLRLRPHRAPRVSRGNGLARSDCGRLNKETSMRISRHFHRPAWLRLGLALLALPTVAFANADVEKNIADSKNWAMQAG